MNEFSRTMIYVAVAAVVGLASWGTVTYTSPRIEKISADEEIGQLLLPDFTDPLAASALEIVEYDETTLQARQFKVQRGDKGLWTIPSHSDYPADAAKQLELAAASVIDLKKLGVVTDNKTEHALYGVIEPGLGSAAAAAEGVGKSVKLTGDGGTLAHFIVGKADPQQPELHFVRLPNQDRVYRVAVDTSKLSTRFQDWIEKDLLKLNAFDIRQLVFDDYTFDEINERKVQNDRVFLNYDGTAWTMEDMEEGKELDVDKLNAMKGAIDSLQIVDVRRKPEGLSADLRSDEGIRLGPEAMQSLGSRGFYFLPERVTLPDGREAVRYDLISNEGEIMVACADGVVYSLRFGEIATNTGGGSGGEEESDETAAGEADEDETAEGDDPAPQADPDANRYVFVTVQFDKSLIPAPELPPLPGEEPAEEPADAPAGDEPNAPAEGDSDSPADETETDETETDETEAAPDAGDDVPEEAAAEEPEAAADDAAAESEEQPAGDCQPEADDESAETAEGGEPAAEGAEETPAEEPVDDDAAEPGDDAESDGDDAESDDAQPVEEGAEGAAPADDARPAGDPAADEAERRFVELERTRLTDEYNEKVAKGEARVKELNARFADWYYVIPDSVYKQIRLRRDGMIKVPPLTPEAGAGALEGLDLEGLRGPGDAPRRPTDEDPADADGASADPFRNQEVEEASEPNEE